MPGWATAISPGPSDESGQAVNFLLDAGVPDIFSTGPAISPGGTLSFTPAANANGTSTVTVSLHDNGGIANGGDDTSAAQTFPVTVTPVNDPPSFTKGGNQTVAEDSGLHTVANWIAPASIVKGPADEASQVVDFVIDTDTNPALFAVHAGGRLGRDPDLHAGGERERVRDDRAPRSRQRGRAQRRRRHERDPDVHDQRLPAPTTPRHAPPATTRRS